MKFVYLDTEFSTKDLTRTGLVSIALCTVEASYYAVNNDMDIHAIREDPEIGPWMTENVFRHIPNHSMHSLDQRTGDVRTYAQIGLDVNAFLRAACNRTGTEEDITVIATCGAQDMVRMHSLLGHSWADHGPWVPHHFDDMRRIKRKAGALGLLDSGLPRLDPQDAHHALLDAEHEMAVHQYIRSRYGDL